MCQPPTVTAAPTAAATAPRAPMPPMLCRCCRRGRQRCARRRAADEALGKPKRMRDRNDVVFE